MSAAGIRRVGVLGRLSLTPEEQLPTAARRALAYLAVHGPVVQRGLMGMRLWPAISETHARANLRRAIWQIPCDWVSASSWEIRIDAQVDLDEARQAADAALAGAPLDVRQIDLLSRDLLPGWYEEWLADDQDAFHLVRVQGLEEACRTSTHLRQYGLATRAGLAAVCAEPLRESAVMALIRAHLDEGNCYEAWRRYRHYRDVLDVELGVEPGPEVTALVDGLGGGRAGRG
ncbi:bacterial transcriptional activator domain-containing protein [Gordonia sp. ABSL1-1]|uniref:AfsR/SARP family transcriptional regulator n=1 Tax=Gordonia sp. ABSL1-1 TaxID=3053923 RepID=UPI002573184A|nr:bacterial transcriptional activator domain-containing protein [Gordonia sp. ABSL1-1]MDL9938653.1 bacterial transcriptional activator domain-containing protein [Gordonia sp. ABSL1-1]